MKVPFHTYLILDEKIHKKSSSEVKTVQQSCLYIFILPDCDMLIFKVGTLTYVCR
jgi:hypothetical protein